MRNSSKLLSLNNQKLAALGNSTNIVNQEQHLPDATAKSRVHINGTNVNDNIDKIFERFVSQQAFYQSQIQAANNLNSLLVQSDQPHLPVNYFLNSKCVENNDNSKSISYPQSNYYYQQYQQQFYQSNLQMFLHRQLPHLSTKNSHLFGNFDYSFPPNFNPRNVSNMAFNEKVTKWMDSIPIFIITEDIIENHCYTPDVSVYWEEEEMDEFFDNYYEDFESIDIDPLASGDEIINFQCKRFDCLNKRLYNLEKKEQ